MMKMAGLICVALALAGCETMPPKMSISRAQTMCSGESGFQLQTKCMENAFSQYYPDWRSDPAGDLLDIYFKWSDLASSHIKDGTMKEEEAQIQAAYLLTQLRDTANNRFSQQYAAKQASLNDALAGLALMQAAHPVATPAPSITRCNSQNIGNTLQTTCQ